ncbi:MAG: DUF4123 domain-containing protein, partial [Janthinobacterium lividum]
VQLLAAGDGSGVAVVDLRSSNGTFLNGARVTEAFAVPGDVLKAGMLALRVVSPLTPPFEAEPVLPGGLETARGVAADAPNGLLRSLTASGVPLFAVLDAAADPAMLEQLQEYLGREPGHTLQSLYEGQGALDLARWAPYLLALPAESTLLGTLLREGWGKAWGCFCTTHVPFSDLRRHLRRFLMVQLEGGPQVYFRFYDPRVLREFLPTATHAELLHFFGPVQEWLVQGGDPGSLLRSRCSADGLVTEALSVNLS